jgi:pimeloyl-ACP methyl ester carboxylesterase
MELTAGYAEGALPAGVRARFIDDINGLRMHVLEAGYGDPSRPLVLLLHGFPELAYSWRKVMLPLAEAGFYVVAPDQRGYGRTTGWDERYDGDLCSFRMPNLVRDAMGLVNALGYRNVHTLVGHDFGSPLAGWCATMRPDFFRSVVMMSAPFPGSPAIPFNTANEPKPAPAPTIHDDLAALPRPRKHYHWYYSTREANDDMVKCPQGLHAFMRAYYHFKSADWKQNKPFRLQGWVASELAKMPTYYIMNLDENMAQSVAPEMPSPAEVAANRWLPEKEMAIYTAEYQRVGFQGGLQWYRCGTSPKIASELEVFAGRTIDVPAMFIGGKSDWGVYQRPGHLERMRDVICTRMEGVHLIDGAGHWVQQEQPERVSELLVAFARGRKP